MGKNKNANGKLPPRVSSSEKERESRESDEGGGGTRLGGGIGGREEKNFRKKKTQQAIRLIFSQPGLWVHCLVFAWAQAVCPGGATF